MAAPASPSLLQKENDFLAFCGFLFFFIFIFL